MAGHMKSAKLAKEISRVTGLSQREADNFYRGLLSAILTLLERGERVNLIGIGTLMTIWHKGGNYYNPKTRKWKRVPTHRFLKFRPSKPFRKMVAEWSRVTEKLHERSTGRIKIRLHDATRKEGSRNG